MLYIGVHSGLSNKLIPLLSLLRITNKENIKINCFWGSNLKSNFTLHFNELFENIDNVNFINNEQYNKVLNSSIIKYHERDPIINHDINDDILFHQLVHAIGYKQDNFKNDIIPYPRKKLILTPSIKELREVIKENIKPIDTIQAKINSMNLNFNNVLGLHLRTSDGGFKRIKIEDSFHIIESHKGKVYVATDTLENEKMLENKYKDKIIIFKNPFGDSYTDKFNRGTYSDMNCIIEMFILSKCKNFMGTPGSSFSFLTWLLRNEPELLFWCDNPWN